MKIHIYGYPSFQAWVEAGMPGSVNSKTGRINGKPKTHLAKCRECDRSMVADGLCLGHYRLARSA